MAKLEVLLAGATGYIGGTILSTLLNSKNDLLEHCNLSLLVRGNDKARVFEAEGLKTVLFNDLDDTQEIERIASNYDCAPDRPITGTYHEPRTFTDTSPDLYPYLQQRNEQTPYAQRTADIAVISTGLASKVNTYIIMPPTIYGTGTGLFNRLTIQAPTIMRSALRNGQVLQLGADDGDVESVHVQDLADLYILVASRIAKGDLEGMPSGTRGIYFAGTSRYTWKEFADGIAGALFEVGGIKTKEIKKIGLEEAAAEWTGGHQLLCELNFGSNFRTRPDTSKSLGWQPSRTKDDFNNHFLETAKLVMQTQA
ncbi:MAG: hypothetical protein Q9172_003455 [Xanthocarpia lactea]